jgi:hypothetical protein
MKGYIYITSSGYDPEKGKSLNDPYLGSTPTLGACMPNIRRQVVLGDSIFVISGKIPDVPQYVIGGFTVAEKIDALSAYKRFPALRLRQTPTGTLDGNIIVTAKGKQHPLDTHNAFATRIDNYIVGRDPIVLSSSNEISKGRRETLDFLQYLFGKYGLAAINIVGRCSRLNEEQVLELQHWLLALKTDTYTWSATRSAKVY